MLLFLCLHCRNKLHALCNLLNIFYTLIIHKEFPKMIIRSPLITFLHSFCIQCLLTVHILLYTINPFLPMLSPPFLLSASHSHRFWDYVSFHYSELTVWKKSIVFNYFHNCAHHFRCELDRIIPDFFLLAFSAALRQ